MNRRAFLVRLSSGLLAGPFASEGQQPSGKVPLVGLFDLSAPDPSRLNWWKALRQGLEELGYAEGRNIRFEARWADGRAERLPALATELIGLQVDLIVTGGGETARIAKQATATIPIVMATGVDPVKLGVIQSLGRPGGNVTGVTSLSSELITKRVSLLRELLPKVSRVAILADSTPNAQLSVQELEGAAVILGVTVHSVRVRGPNDLDRAFSEAAKDQALFVVGSPVQFPARKRIADLAVKHRLPTVVGGRDYVEAGGLLSYAVSYPALFRRAAWYVDKILKGAKPADPPVEQPTTFELIINLRTARALGLTIPQALLRRADEVIQ